jgi:signal transduction histidine kinase
MNTVGVTALVVLAVVSVLWTVLLIPALLELRRATWRLQEFIRTLELELRPTLQEARETIRAMTQAAQGVGEGAARLRGAMAAMEEAGGNLRATTGVLRAVFGSRLIPVASILAGVRAGIKALLQR